MGSIGGAGALGGCMRDHWVGVHEGGTGKGAWGEGLGWVHGGQAGVGAWRTGWGGPVDLGIPHCNRFVLQFKTIIRFFNVFIVHNYLELITPACQRFNVVFKQTKPYHCGDK